MKQKPKKKPTRDLTQFEGFRIPSLEFYLDIQRFLFPSVDE